MQSKRAELPYFFSRHVVQECCIRFRCFGASASGGEFGEDSVKSAVELQLPGTAFMAGLSSMDMIRLTFHQPSRR